LLNALKENNKTQSSTIVKNVTKETSNNFQNATINDAVLGKKSKSQNPPFLLTFDIFNKIVHNFLVDLGASSNIMPYLVCTKLNATPPK
jgi:hypothetical protein